MIVVHYLLVDPIHLLYVFFGVAGTGPYYGFWSGAGSDLAYMSVVILAWRHLNCGRRGCWRIGLHKIDNNTSLKVCHLHHPVVTERKLTDEEIHHRWHAHYAREAA